LTRQSWPRAAAAVVAAVAAAAAVVVAAVPVEVVAVPAAAVAVFAGEGAFAEEAAAFVLLPELAESVAVRTWEVSVLLPEQAESVAVRTWVVSAVRRTWVASAVAHRCLRVFDLPSVEWPDGDPSALPAG
jgi:hypothetical protein